MMEVAVSVSSGRVFVCRARLQSRKLNPTARSVVVMKAQAVTTMILLGSWEMTVILRMIWHRRARVGRERTKGSEGKTKGREGTKGKAEGNQDSKVKGIE